MFTRVDRRARTLLLRSLHSLAPFIEAVECVVLHFIQVRAGRLEVDGMTRCTNETACMAIDCSGERCHQTWK